MRASLVNDHMNLALDREGQPERHAALLALYLTAPQPIRDTIFADAAYRLSFYGDAVTTPSSLPTEDASGECAVASPAPGRLGLLGLFRRLTLRSQQLGS